MAAANLAGQQSLAYGNAMAPILQQGYNTALSTAQQQQGVTLAAQQADAARLSAAGQQIANIGTQGQTAGLAGAQAQMAAGQVGQQTTQAGDTALYNQFLQQQSYPFQTAQFLANIAEGTGALSGQTTTTTQPSSFFSDRRLKENIKKIGTAKNGLPIYSFNYKEDPEKVSRLGFMADEVEKKHPEAVGLAGGFKTVDYEKAARPKRYAGGLLADSTGGLVTDDSRGGFDQGGSPGDWTAILQQHEGMYGPQAGGLYGGSAQATPGKPSYVPSSSVPQHQPLRPGNIPALPQSGLKQAIGDATQAENLYKMGTDPKGLGAAVYNKVAGTPAVPLDLHPTPAAPPPANPIIPDPNATDSSTPAPGNARGGFLRARGGLADGGDPEGLYQAPGAGLSIPNENQTAQNLSEQKAEAPQSSGSSSSGGLGDALKLAGLVIPFLANGGLVRRRREDGGPVAEDLEFARGGLADGGDPAGGATLDASDSAGPPDLTPDQMKLGLEKLRAAQAAQQEPQETDVPLPPRRPEGLGLGVAASVAGTREQTSTPAPGLAPVAAAPAEQAIAQAAPSVAGNKKISPEVDALWANQMHQESGGKQFNDDGSVRMSPKGAAGIAQVTPGTAPEAARLAGVPFDQDRYLHDPAYNEMLGKAYMQAQYEKYGDTGKALAAYNAGPGAVDKAVAHGGDNYLSYLPSETQNYVASIQNGGSGSGGGGGGKGNGLAGGQQLAQNAGNTLSDTASGLGKSVTDTGQKAGDWYGQNQNWLGPLLQGLGTMASSNSRYLGSAVLQGLGGGAEAYAKQQASQANIGQTQAGTAETAARTAETAAHTQSVMLQNLQSWQHMTPTGPRSTVVDSQGHVFDLPSQEAAIRIRKGENLRPINAGADLAPGAVGPQPTGAKPLGALPPTALPGAQQPGLGVVSASQPVATSGRLAPLQAAPAPATPGVNYSPETSAAAQSEDLYDPKKKTLNDAGAAYADQTAKIAANARETMPYSQKQVTTVADALAEQNGGKPGAGGDTRANLINIGNTAARLFGYTGEPLGNADNEAQLLNKLSTMRTMAARAGAGPQSLGEFDAIKAAVPNMNMPPDAMASLTAQLMVDQVKAEDRAAHLARYTNGDNASAYSSASDRFDKDNGSGKYNREAEQLKQMILTKPAMLHKLMSGQYTKSQIEEVLTKKYGADPGMSRYFAWKPQP